MKFQLAVILLVVKYSYAYLAPSQGIAPSRIPGLKSLLATASVDPSVTVTGAQNVSWRDITSLTYRKLQQELKSRNLNCLGTTAVLRERLYVACGGECVVDDRGKAVGDCAEDDAMKLKGIMFVDESNQDLDFEDLVAEIQTKAELNHWKAATRKLKKLQKGFSNPVPQEVYLSTLRACMADRLNGARAAEPARRILEVMSENEYPIPKDVINYCILNSLGDGPDGTHDNCGGIDCALAMMATVDKSMISEEAFGRLATVLAKAGDLKEAEAMLRVMIVDESMTPQLGVLADVAMAIATSNQPDVSSTMNILALAKAAGYQLDNIASTVDGRSLLGAGLIAAEKINNVALGLRLLTAASQAKGCDPDRGDALVSSASSSVQRAATLIHKSAIKKAVEDGSWKVAVKLMELMTERSLRVSPAIWKSVVTCCAKNEKSRKATQLLLDWVKLSDVGEMEKPPLRLFNSVVNACEICDEQELTLVVLDAMKKTHNTDGNLITFNIALKRLAKLGNVAACEGIIIGMLQQEVEPSVVSYTTAIAACALEGKKNPASAYQWLQRMRSRNVMPNVMSYNTALAACLDGKLSSTMLGSKIASEMLIDVGRQLAEGVKDDIYTTVFPDVYTKSVARQLMKQLRENWRNNEIDIRVAKATVRQPLLQLVDFRKSDQAAAVAVALESIAALSKSDEEGMDTTIRDEEELEYAAAAFVKRTAEV